MKKIIFILISFAASYSSISQSQLSRTDSLFLKKLSEIRVGQSTYLISIPHEYALTEKEGPGGLVYHIEPTDTAFRTEYSAGFYFNDFPKEFVTDDTCKSEKFQGGLLNNISYWTAIGCVDYLIQVIATTNNKNHPIEKIHAFGYARSTLGLKNILLIFSTLRKL